MYSKNSEQTGWEYPRRWWDRRSIIDQCIDVFVYVDSDAGHQPNWVVSFTHDALLSGSRSWWTEPVTTICILLYAYLGRHVMGQSIDHVRSGCPMRTMAGITATQQGWRWFRARPNPSVTSITLMWRFIFTHIQYFDAVGHGKEIQQDTPVAVQYPLVGWRANDQLLGPASCISQDREDVSHIDWGITSINERLNIRLPGAPDRFESYRW